MVVSNNFQVYNPDYYFFLVYGIKITLNIKFEVELLKIAVGSCLTDSQSLKTRLIDI